jgi:DNA-binding transcriptional LysR family regulator
VRSANKGLSSFLCQYSSLTTLRLNDRMQFALNGCLVAVIESYDHSQVLYHLASFHNIIEATTMFEKAERLTRMELRHLRSFIAVAQALNYGRASRKLHLSQSALSTQIRQLEEDLGVQLFLRNRRVVELTPAGAIFVKEAQETLARAEKAMERVRKVPKGELGELRVGFVSSAALEIVPQLVVAFRKAFPDIELDLINLRTSTQLEELGSGSVDVGFLRLPANQRLLSLSVIHSEPFVIVLPQKHALSKKPVLTLADLYKEKFVAYGRQWAPGFFDYIMAMFLKAGYSPEIVQETGEMFTTTSLVAAGLGVAIMPRSVVLAQTAGVVFKPLPLSVGVSQIGIAISKDNIDPIVRSFVNFSSRFRKARA